MKHIWNLYPHDSTSLRECPTCEIERGKHPVRPPAQVGTGFIPEREHSCNVPAWRAGILWEVGNVLDHWEQLPNDFRLDPTFKALDKALQKLYKAVME